VTKRVRKLKSVLSVSSLALAALVAATPLPALAQSPATAMPLEAQLLGSAPMELRTFYATQENKSLWVAQDGTLDPAANDLLKLVETARYDGVDPAAIGVDQLQAALDRLQTDRSPAALTAVDVALSGTLVAYAKAMLQPGSGGMVYEHANLEPFVLNSQLILEGAAKAGSLDEYITQMEWMHPLYAPIRQALLASDGTASTEALAQNLARLRAIPRNPGERYIIVDTANAMLYMYEHGQVVDSMRVGVGKPDSQTPAYAGYVRYAILNPYWNVPEDLVPHRLAPSVVREGVGYIKRRQYQIISDYGPDAQILDPSKIDWRAVAKGTAMVKARQLPTVEGMNAMGQAKFEFPNVYGIYLHDTNEPKLLEKDDRHFSSGCIRLQDYKRLGRWLFGGQMPTVSSTAFEQQVDLPAPVPIYVTYITARPASNSTQIALGPDPYGRDSGNVSLPTPASVNAALAHAEAAPAPQPAAHLALAPAEQPAQPAATLVLGTVAQAGTP
jgi:murein L,D-transpeptidase YcbB/YkuD